MHTAASHPHNPLGGVTFGPPDLTTQLDVIVTRGDLVESRHRVHAAVVDASGRLLVSARDPLLLTWWRSCAKPFQALPLVESGQLDALGWGTDELALACASHGGEPEHVALAGAMLSRIGLEAGDLACGPHEPLAARGARLLRESGLRPTRLHNNCSGKHAAMLARAVVEGWPSEGYERHEHPVQRAARDSVARWTGLVADQIPLAVDGCGVTVFGVPLANMAWSYARLAMAAARGDDGPARVVGAMTSQPFLVGGTDRFDTLLMTACEGRVLCKIGAEGVHTLALVERGIGIAVKVEDGQVRAQYPAVLAVLHALGELPDPLPDALRDLTGRLVRNTRGETVGEIRLSALDVGQSIHVAPTVAPAAHA
jgi:L-asparaginase II